MLPGLTPIFTCHYFDFEGHGGQPLPARFGIEHFASQVASYLRQHGPMPVLGYSMGGYVAAYASIALGAPITRLVTLGTKWAWTPEAAGREAGQLNPDFWLQKAAAFAQALQTLHGAKYWRPLVAQTAQMMLAMGKQPPLGPVHYAKLNIPLTLLLGQADRMVTLEETTAVAHYAPQAQVRVLPNTPHPLEKVEAGLLVTAIKESLPDEGSS